MCISVYLSMLIVIYDCWCSFFFFFKQKTAYEMRISDWSSDVCSSDLALADLGDEQERAGLAGGFRSSLGLVRLERDGDHHRGQDDTGGQRQDGERRGLGRAGHADSHRHMQM